jgi:hypothetical protein
MLPTVTISIDGTHRTDPVWMSDLDGAPDRRIIPYIEGLMVVICDDDIA